MLDDENLTNLVQVLNRLYNNKMVPESWNDGRVTTIYKNKGKRGAPKNMRGITVTSVMAKLVEKLVYENFSQDMEISELQGGGKGGTGTRDHLLVLNSIINKYKNKNTPLNIVFLDVEKAYDRGDFELILHVMKERGCNMEDWVYMDALNENNKVKIKTTFGLTSDIQTGTIIKQGGVLSPIQFSLLIDEIGKNLASKDKGLILIEQGVPCLLWVDDIVTMHTELEEVQTMLDIIYEMSNKYNYKFGMDKSKHLIIGEDPHPSINLHLGDRPLEKVKNYKYLGAMINSEADLEDHIKMIAPKITAAVREIKSIVMNNSMKNIEMKVIKKLVGSNIDSILCYGLEAITIKTKEMGKIKREQIKALRYLLDLHKSISDKAMLMDLGIYDIEYTIYKRKILYYSQLIKEGFQENSKKAKKKSKKNLNEVPQLRKYENKDCKEVYECECDTCTNTKTKRTETEKELYEKCEIINKGYNSKSKIILHEAINSNRRWMNEINNIMRIMRIQHQDLHLPREQLVKKINDNAIELMKEDLEKKGETKKLTERYINNMEEYDEIKFGKEYTDEESLYTVKLLMEARMGLFPCRNNYNHCNYGNVTCRWCNEETETEEHVMECHLSPIQHRGFETKKLYGEENRKEAIQILREYQKILSQRGEKR